MTIGYERIFRQAQPGCPVNRVARRIASGRERGYDADSRSLVAGWRWRRINDRNPLSFEAISVPGVIKSRTGGQRART